MKKRTNIKQKKSQNSSKNGRHIFYILARYIILLFIGASLSIIYLIIAPLTVYPVNYLLNLFVKTFLYVNSSNNYIFLIENKTLVEIVPACVAGSAYFLLIILNLTISLEVKKRIYSMIYSCLALLILNIFRIFIFSLLYYYNASFVDFTHKIFWYGLSTVFVVAIWFSTVKLFKIKEIPVYSDLKFVWNKIKNDR